ncbi:tryptophan synthase beta subunit-like PLP-dependent enzyme [Flagelloscypha sp. PMI_526]|nr:tryptophan synthase beta subunit-like PLP-dependent enzyme [Flagelloscypha sp. PMI_526]
MPSDPILNVYSGEEALEAFWDPDQCPPVPLVELPERLNHLRKDGVRIYAKLMSALPASNVKSLPALNMILRAKESGEVTENTHTLVEYSSGSTVISMAMIANIMGIPKVKAYMSNKTSTLKLNLLRFFGVDLTVFGGHGQPEPNDPNGGIKQANIDGEQDGWYNPDQYSNPTNYESHMRWTGPQLMKQLPKLALFAATIGTSGTMTGTGLYLKEHAPQVKRLGLVVAPMDRVPGPRYFSLLSPVEFPWRDAIDSMEEIASPESFAASLQLCRNGLLVGPSSGMALVGVLKYLDREKAEGRLDALKNDEGEIVCAFICCDQPFQYIQDYMKKLGPEHFPTINRSELLDVDTYNYDNGWEVTPTVAHAIIFDSNWVPPKVVGIQPHRGIAPAASDDDDFALPTLILDLRDDESFRKCHLPNSLHLPVDASTDPNPYMDPPTMVKLFRTLDARLGANDPEFGGELFKGHKVLILSHRGHSARLAMSVLRERNVKAFCVMTGVDGWKEASLWGNWSI